MEYRNYIPFQKDPEDFSYIKGGSIDWAQVDMWTGTWQDLNDLMDILEDNGITMTDIDMQRKTKFNDMVNRFRLINAGNYAALKWNEVWTDKEGNVHECARQISTSATNLEDSQETIRGGTAWRRVKWRFYRSEGIEMVKAFGGYGIPMELKHMIRLCVPIPVSYGFESMKPFDHVYKVDISSAYPYEYTKDLPTMDEYKLVDGTAEPNEEYPYAIYLHSRHIKIFNELDTRDFDCDFYDYIQTGTVDIPTGEKYPSGNPKTVTLSKYPKIDPEKDKTVLMKRSKYNFKNVFESMFEKRNLNPIYKEYMNRFNGMNFNRSFPVLPWLSAIIMARTVRRVLDEALKIESNGESMVILIATDAIAWVNGYIPDYDLKRKKLGSFHYEHKDARAMILGPKKYQMLDPDGAVTTKWAGRRKELQKNINFGDMLKDPEAKGIIEVVACIEDESSGKSPRFAVIEKNISQTVLGKKPFWEEE